MSEWWTYHPEDFLLFSERVYWRLFELHNAVLWPAQIPALLLGACVLILLLRPPLWAGRVIALILAAAWMFVAWAFFWNTYATINWAARYVAPIFVLEALLIAWVGALHGRLRLKELTVSRNVLGLLLFVYALAIHPLVSVIAGRPLAAAEVFGITPDPTVIGTLGVFAMMTSSWRSWLLLVIPLAWCAMSWATLQLMGAREAWALLLALALMIIARSWRFAPHRRRP